MQRYEIKEIQHNCYIITNILNNKIYIGITHRDIKDRFKEHIKLSRRKADDQKTAIAFAIKKYGKENFKIELLGIYENRKLAFNAEIVFIKQYNSNNIKFGYNETEGGDGGPIMVKYKKELIISILEDYVSGIGLKDLSIKYKIGYHSVFDITRRRVGSLYELPVELENKLKNIKNNSSKRRKIDKKLLIKIINEYIIGKSLQYISDKYLLSINTTWNAINRYSSKNIIIDFELENKLKDILKSRKHKLK